MLSYEHVYHAGNHADILKHLTLTLILKRLLQKDKPFTVYDTHAGFGVYELTEERAQKTNEAESGIRRLLQSEIFDLSKHESPQVITAESMTNITEPYLSLCRAYATEQKYPGSPEIARCLLRPTDKLILSELHPQAIEVLRHTMKIPPLALNTSEHTQALQKKAYVTPQIHFRNGFEMIRALTPPATKRGMAIIDPSFEEAQDFSDCADTICAVHERWQNGILALWYPLLEHRATEIARMKQQIISCAERTQTEPNILDIQLAVQSPEEKTGLAKLYGSGMFVVNFPYQLDEQMEAVLPYLTRVLGNEKATWSVEKF
ncbi:MAG: 23S rRNA (adenine(2030)-N(6))-methyltransferase RlmJ [Treponema sp.]|nr:23S rRNA (adenine(2030)-N(6))-methyltransferase RlmJ [Treponema sp.]